MKRKTYYFICGRCNRRKPQEQESDKPGVCDKCRQRDWEADERDYGYIPDSK